MSGVQLVELYIYAEGAEGKVCPTLLIGWT